MANFRTHQSGSRRKRRGKIRSGMAALEAVMTTAVTFTVLGFSSFWLIRFSRVLFSVVGQLVGCPLM